MMNSIEASSNSMGGWPGFGFGGGWGGWGGGGVVEGLLLGSLFLGRGFGRGDDCGRNYGGCEEGHGFGSGSSNLAYLMGKSDGEEAKYRDIVDATANINGSVRDGFNFTNANIERVRDGVASGFYALGERVCEAKYDNLIQFKELTHQIATATCATQRAIEMDGDATRALINRQNEQNLRDTLDETRRQRDLLATGNFPISQPAHVHKHHCGSQEDGVQVQINNVNQNVQALGSVVGQVADLVNRLNAQLAKQSA